MQYYNLLNLEITNISEVSITEKIKQNTDLLGFCLPVEN